MSLVSTSGSPEKITFPRSLLSFQIEQLCVATTTVLCTGQYINQCHLDLQSYPFLKNDLFKSLINDEQVSNVAEEHISKK